MAAEAADCGGRRRFAVACSVLSQYVRAETAAAAAAAAHHSRCPPVAQPQPLQAAASASPMLLMPGADVVSEEEEEETAPTPTPVPAPASAQLTIVYGGRALVFDHVGADRAAEVMRVAARRDVAAGGGGQLADLQVARKASLRRVMENRRDRLRRCAPYAAPACAPAPPTEAAAQSHKEQLEKDAGIWLGLGIPG